MDTLGSEYRNMNMLYCYWPVWLIQVVVMAYSHFREKPNLIRFLNLIIILRNIIPWLNFEDRKTFDDIAYLT